MIASGREDRRCGWAIRFLLLCDARGRGPRCAVRNLVRPVCQVDACGRSRDAKSFRRPLPGGYFRSDHGPSGAVARSKVDALQDGGHARTRSTPPSTTILHRALTTAPLQVCGQARRRDPSRRGRLPGTVARRPRIQPPRTSRAPNPAQREAHLEAGATGLELATSGGKVRDSITENPCVFRSLVLTGHR